MRDFLCHINGTSRYVHLSLKAIFQREGGKGINVCVLYPRRFIL